LRMLPSESEGSLSSIFWSENPGAGQRSKTGTTLVVEEDRELVATGSLVHS
jgi:hypothetical protein